MTGHTHSLSEWAAFGSLGISIHAALSVPYFLLVESESARDFDPRPAVRRALNTDLGARAVVAMFNAQTDLRELAADLRQYTRLSLRETALTVAALLALLLPAAGGTR